MGPRTGWRGVRSPRIALPAVLALGLATSVAGCVAARVESERTFDYGAEYLVSCSVSDECRVTYIDETGELVAEDVTGEWSLSLGADPGSRLWLRAGAGGCPPRPVRIRIQLEGETVAEQVERPPARARCEWILAETEFRVP